MSRTASPIWTQTRTGRPVDLGMPDLSSLDVEAAIAVPLARIARFTGQTRDAPWSVAQHCVVGADALLAETGCATTALVFLVHDAPEALIGDITRPARLMIAARLEAVVRSCLGAEIAAALSSIPSDRGRSAVELAIDWAEADLLGEIHRLAGLPSLAALPPAIRRTSAEMDLRMLATEMRQLMPTTSARVEAEIWPGAVRAARPIRLPGRLTPWGERRASAEWMRRWETWRIHPESTFDIGGKRRDDGRKA